MTGTINILYRREVLLAHTTMKLHALPPFFFYYVLLQLAIVQGQVENTKVQELKYGSEKKSHLSVSSALLTHNCVLTDVLQRCES